MSERLRQLDDVELVARARNHDHEAFSILVDRYGETMFNLAQRMIGNAHDAHDVVQETFVSAFKALNGFRADARFSTWLYRIGLNKCKDWLKTHGRRHERESGSTTEEDGEDDPITRIPDDRTPEATLSQKQTARVLEEAIQRLPPLYREAFILKHLEGIDYAEMSDMLGVGRDTLKMRVYKARTQLCRDLQWLR
ncbi:MAG: sigma-70 family RNA polymerase sigma factor, partial [Nitrospirae bacterium]